MENEQKKSGLNMMDLIIYSVGGMGAIGFQGIIKNFYYMMFMTNVMLLPTVAAASIYTSLTVVSIVAMALSGVVVDSIRLPWGKLRSWILIGNIISVATVGFMFYRFDNISVAGYTFYAIGINFIYNLGYNFTWVGVRSLMSPMSSSSEDTTKLATFADLIPRIFGLFTGLLGAWLVANIGGLKQGYMWANFLMAIPTVIFTPIFMKMTKKYDPPTPKSAVIEAYEEKKKPEPEKVSFADMIKSFSRPAVCYYLAAAFACAQTSFFSVLLAYYTSYILNNPTILGISTTVSSVGAFIGVSLTPMIRKKFSNKHIYAYLTMFNAIIYLGIMIINGSPYLFLVLRFISALAATPTSPVMVSLANDVADYNEMKGISNARGFVTSMMGTMIRVGRLIASAISSFGLAAVGFDATKPMTEPVIKAIVTLMGWGPAAVCIIAGVIMLLYNVDEKEIDEYRKQKAVLRAEAKA